MIMKRKEYGAHENRSNIGIELESNMSEADIFSLKSSRYNLLDYDVIISPALLDIFLTFNFEEQIRKNKFAFNYYWKNLLCMSSN